MQSLVPDGNISRKEAANTFLLALGFGAFMLCFQLFLLKSTFISQWMDDTSLLKWDAGVYGWLAKDGYVHDDARVNNTGIFMLFSFVWRFLRLFGITVMGMCVVNYILFSIGFTILSSLYKLTTSEKLLWLSVPMVYIIYIPYTEALFFLLMAVTFYGIVKESRWAIWAGLFLASLTRATGIFLLPALLVMELVANPRKEWYKVIGTYLVDYALPIIAGLAFFVWYQHHKVGIWFAYFIQQKEYEGHSFNMPIFPLSSMEGARNIWVGALAVLVCVIAIVAAIRQGGKWLFKGIVEPDKLLMLSCVFLSITLYKTVFYNPIWRTGSTLLIGINRYVFATPFFYVFLHRFSDRHAPYKVVNFIAMFFLCNAIWLACGAYVHILHFIFFNFATLIVFLYMFQADKRLAWPGMLIMGMNICMQIMMFQQYLQGLYLD